MDALLQDVRYALRQMRRAPVLATAIVLTIGLGLGAAAAIFTSSEAALVEPLPYAAPDRLVHLWELRAGTDERSPTSYPTLLDWRARTTSFVGLEGYDPSIPVVGTGDEARMLRGAEVTAGFFRLLGVRLSTGRDFVGDEGDAAGARVAIVSARFARAVALGVHSIRRSRSTGCNASLWGYCRVRHSSRCCKTRTYSSLSSSAINAVRTGLTGQFTWWHDCRIMRSCRLPKETLRV